MLAMANGFAVGFAALLFEDTHFFTPEMTQDGG
jgi:hypothetical protein